MKNSSVDVNDLDTNYLCVSLDLNNSTCKTPFTDRSIQTTDKKIIKQLLNDVEKLISKYQEKGCHIGK